VPGPTTDALGRVAKETRAVVIASVFERRAAGVYHNTAVVLDADGALRGLYRKMHIPDDPLYYEKFYFTPATSASAPSTPPPGGSAPSCAGTSGTPRRRA